MPPTFRGTKNAILQGRRESYSPTNGLVREYDYRGFGEAQMIALANQWIASGAHVTFHERHGIYGCTVADTSGSYIIDSWEVTADYVRKPSVTNPLHAGVIPTDELNLISFAQNNGVADLDEATKLLKKVTGVDYSATLSAAGKRLWQRISAGLDTYAETRYVLRHTTNVSNRWNVNIADINVNRVYTPAQLLSEAQNAGLWVFPLPGRLSYKLNAIPFPTVPANFIWGWLKSASSEVTSANNRVNIATEYALDLYSTDEFLTA